MVHSLKIFKFDLIDFIKAFLITIVIFTVYFIFNNGFKIYNNILRKVKSMFLSLPIVSSTVKKDLEKAVKETRLTLHKPLEDLFFQEKLPNGLNYKEIINLSKTYELRGSKNLYDGKISGCVYIEPHEDLIELHNKICKQYMYSNPLHPDVFPEIMRMEAEVVRMCCDLFGGNNKTSCGVMTSGGTESILLACLAYRNYANSTKGIKYPEILVGESAHVAFNKACHYFGIKPVKVALDSRTLAVDVSDLRRRITWNTIAIVASAPAYPHGIIDPISDIAKIGLEHQIPVHVDCCLGGFLVPFAFEAGYDDLGITKFLMCEGITSVSADTHKYGYTPKGSSVILYNDHKYLHAQYYISTDWMGGMYPSQTLSGSRSGLNIALCWATLLYFGRKGYVDSTKKIVATCRNIIDAFKEKEIEPRKIEFKVMGDPKLNVLAFGNAPNSIYDIYELGKKMTDKGWNLNYLQNPHGIHIGITLVHTKEGICQNFIKDMVESDKELKLECENRDGKKDTSIGALYCFAQSISNQAPVRDVIIRGYLDGYYSAPSKDDLS